MRTVRVVSRKYDGSLREEYETTLYTESNETITLFSPSGLRYYDHRKAAWLEAPDGLLEIYFKTRWYNVWHIAEQVSGRNLSYVNIATPATLREGVLEWTDLDLDYRVQVAGQVERLDAAEFAQNAQRLGYPPVLLAQTHKACLEVESGLARRVFPFDYEQQVERYRRIKRELTPEG